ncbi:MAG: hypothetical protein ACI9GZ_000358 [Bacteroidia bacterium]
MEFENAVAKCELKERCSSIRTIFWAWRYMQAK